jgi:DnaJ family protein C protein 9
MVESDDDEEEEQKHAPTAASNVPARFAGQTAYEVLGVARTATAEELKKAYRRMALRVHPDVNHAPSATVEFQYLSRCHEMLANPRRRARYDATGSMEDGSDGADNDDMRAAAERGDAYAYWRTLFPKIDLSDIEAYRAKYVGGAEEQEDVLAAWHQHKTLRLVYESVPFADAASMPRLIALLNEHAGARISKAAQLKFIKELEAEEGSEAAEAEAAMQELLTPKERKLLQSNGHGSAAAAASSSSNGDSGLALILQSRQRDRSGHLFADLEARYGGGAGSKRKGAAAAASGNGSSEPEGGHPSEEAFEAMRKRMEQNKGQKGTAKESPKKKSKK